ncbi:MAG: ABC transporter substrate-binding protein [Hungatella sp.]|jgi:NitT/TauT family transport system substrate-binding protein|nr:ABC transporter substrate-binding protein [Hungatella sp.]
MKRTLSFLMACAMTAALMTGCSYSSKESPETGTQVQTEATTTASAPETAQAPAAAETEKQEVSLEAPGASHLRIGSLKGPTSMGLVSLMDKVSKDAAEGDYEFIMVTDASELVAQMVSGSLDIALVPANMASILYQKTNHGINVLDINTLGVLYVVSADDSIKSISDLKGKTVYMTGKGTTPDYVLKHLLSASGLTSDDVTIEYKSEATEVAAVLAQDGSAIGLLPQPFVTAAMAQNDSLKMVLDLTKEWDNIQSEDGGSLVTGVTVCRSQLFEDAASARAIDTFMKEHKESAEYANANVEETAQLVASAGIIEKAPVAAKAIPYCSITYIDGEEMKEKLYGYLSVLYSQDPSSVGGELPDKSFFYLP